jgi:hypothetical protein
MSALGVWCMSALVPSMSGHKVCRVYKSWSPYVYGTLYIVHGAGYTVPSTYSTPHTTHRTEYVVHGPQYVVVHSAWGVEHWSVVYT